MWIIPSNHPIETWKPVFGYENMYQISNQGRIKSLYRTVIRRNGTTRTVPEIVLRISIQSQGYPVVTLSKLGKNKKVRVSRIVAIAFVPNPKKLPEVNHEDGNKLNCVDSNLSWTDRSGNLKHAYRTGLRKKPTGYTHAMRNK